MHAEFQLTPDIVYLNHAGVAPWPKATAAAVIAFARENLTHGATHYPTWLRVERRLRERIARLINASDPGQVALVKNTSEALSFVAKGLSWQAGDNVVSVAQEFPSNRIVWESLADRGVELRLLDLGQSSNPEADLLRLCDRATRLISISAVQFARGLRMRLRPIGDYCRANDILFCVDAIQQVGALPFDVQDARADFAAADGHKWMLGPEGLGFFYVRREAQDRLRPSQFGWHMVAAAGDYDNRDWRPADDARRFECGSPNMLGIHALDASLAVIEREGIDAISAAIAANISLCFDISNEMGLEVLSPREPERQSGIFTFRSPGVDSGTLHQALTANGVICAKRGGGIRFSPHFYTTAQQIEHAFGLMREHAARP
jgi:selenocysteine lyase/cysteine desulfurase